MLNNNAIRTDFEKEVFLNIIGGVCLKIGISESASAFFGKIDDL
jgi:hypothetical protein